MSEGGVTKSGVVGARPGREATTGVIAGRASRAWRPVRGERPMVEPARFQSYYGLPVIKQPVWESPEIPGYLFLGGLAGASSLLGAGGQLTGRPTLARGAKAGAAAAGLLSIAALVHDLGRPTRFLNMLRVFKPTSPMSVGSFLLAAYVPAAAVAAASELAGILPVTGSAATLAAAGLGPAVASYTAALITDTAVPGWHEGYRLMPFVFVSSAASAAGGLGMVAASLEDGAPARRLATAGGALELVLTEVMRRQMHETVRRHYDEGKAGRFLRAAKGLTAAGVVGGLLAGGRSRIAAAVSGAALVLGSAATRFGIFWAGHASSADPAATVVPQRERLEARDNRAERATALS